METLKQLFNTWADYTNKQYLNKQWLLSKWDVYDEIDWPLQKREIMLQMIKRALHLKKSDHFADLGCGGGWILKEMKPCVQKTTGVDFSLNMLKYARTICPRDQFVCGELGRLPFRDQSFDRVLCNFVFINIEENAYILKSITEIMRVLKKKGRALISQLPDKNGSQKYDADKASYLQYCREVYKIKKNTHAVCQAPLHLFNRNELTKFLKDKKISFEILDSFNPFYRLGETSSISWRFDLLLKKN